MYSASNAFHTAVANGAHQIALLIFEDSVFTNDDINVTAGIQFNDYFNTDEDLSIGQALSNEISFRIFNDDGLLNDYAFGDFTATIGAQIDEEEYVATGTVMAQSANHTYIAYETSPYLKRDGVAVSAQPGSPVVSILVYDGLVYCGLENGTVRVYRDSTGALYNKTVNDFMKSQFQKWAGKGISYDAGNRDLKIWDGTNVRTYEFVPLGKFTAERPNVPTVIEIDFNCMDFMQKFERDMPSATALGITYPATIGTLYTKLCNYVGVDYRSSSFINSTATIQAEPEAFADATMREVLQWIAEAAASNVKFDRDGYLRMDWLRNTNQTIDETGYSDFNPYWYNTKKVTKLYNQASSGEYANTYGNGSEGYLIQDNPLLEGVS